MEVPLPLDEKPVSSRQRGLRTLLNNTTSKRRKRTLWFMAVSLTLAYFAKGLLASCDASLQAELRIMRYELTDDDQKRSAERQGD
jgi:hypothetical protein